MNEYEPFSTSNRANSRVYHLAMDLTTSATHAPRCQGGLLSQLQLSAKGAAIWSHVFETSTCAWKS